MSNSEIARIREQIELECLSMANVSQFASVASHEMIRDKYRHLDDLSVELAKYVPEDEAFNIVVTTYNSILQ